MTIPNNVILNEYKMYIKIVYVFPGGSHIITPSAFLDDVKALSGDGNDAGNDYE